MPAMLASSDASLRSLSTRSVSGALANSRASAAPSVPPAPVIATTRHASLMRSHQQVAAVDVDDGAGHERRSVGREELIRAGEVARITPPPLRRVVEHAGLELRVVLPRLGHRRVEPSRRDDVDGYAGGREIERQTF